MRIRDVSPAVVVFLLSMFLSLLTKRCVQAHFIFAELIEDDVRVFFSEPVAMEGDGIKYLGGRVSQLAMIGPTSNRKDPAVINLRDDGVSGYLSGSVPETIDNTPYFLTGFLDYGDFGEGDGPKADLQYTFSTQISSTSPSDDWSHFFHGVSGTDGESPFGDHNDPFVIAMKNYGPPYRVVMRGISATTLVRVCIYEGNGSNREVECVEGTHNRTHHLTFDPDAFGVLNPCETYFALGNTTVTDEVTGKMKNMWSSTSITWNGPCIADRSRTPVPQWYETSHYNYGCAHSTTEVATSTETPRSSLISSPNNFVTVSLAFASGLLVGIAAYRIAIWSQKQKSGGAHIKIDTADEVTACYSDDGSTTELT